MNKLTLAAHESLEIHEVLNFKTLCLAKSKLMQGNRILLKICFQMNQFHNCSS
ncbi:hypothetical protein BRIN106911_24335 [Brevibacillus invocatus]